MSTPDDLQRLLTPHLKSLAQKGVKLHTRKCRDGLCADPFLTFHRGAIPMSTNTLAGLVRAASGLEFTGEQLASFLSGFEDSTELDDTMFHSAGRNVRRLYAEWGRR